ncbi:transcriptional regulator [[Bacillus] enclensis]|uniref:transcriptional regulator n=1 Tax=[Bacillus] enclensis TaxID=1402860 RepID=UPI0018DE4D11|nr:transcriptional regulator [[Bacillus] enclensis]MBH9967211.1 transcriptional regulator [[Bacillus] enclensis]
MNTKIALIGSRDFTEHVQASIAPRLNGIDLIPYIYSEPQEAEKLISTIVPCDAVLFSGALPYFFTKEACKELMVPVLYLEQDETALITSLFHILQHLDIKPEHVSIDLMDTAFVEHIMTDLHLQNPPQYVMDYKSSLPHNFSINEYATFHQRLFQEGKTRFALTSIHSVYDRLVQLNIPCMRMIDPAKSLMRTINEARSQALLSKRKASTIAAVRLIVQEKNSGLQKLVHLMEGTLQKKDDDSAYTVFSNRGSIENLLETAEFHSFFQVNQPVLAGFGYGHTAAQAEENAETALSFASKYDTESCAFIVNEEKELSGPYPDKNKKQQLKYNHPDMLSLAKQLKLSPANLSKIMQFYKNRTFRDFTASELSDYMQISRRSAERILKKLVDNGSARITGEEMTYAQGRPRAVYELSFPMY